MSPQLVQLVQDCTAAFAQLALGRSRRGHAVQTAHQRLIASTIIKVRDRPWLYASEEDLGDHV